MKATSLYIHIPYCASKCIYCDFYSGGDSIAQWSKLTDALLNEFNVRKHEFHSEPDTLYIGGGTPSLMPCGELTRLVEKIAANEGSCQHWKEFTIEVNPDDVTEEKCNCWKNLGVNRVSMGVQSFNDVELQSLKRRHDSTIAIQAYHLLRKYFRNISIDLMFGIPGQTLESWQGSVKKAMELYPDHLSAYSLMLEEGTALSHLYNIGKIELPSEEDCDKMWNCLSRELKDTGYEQYEISNYSLPGFRSIHNSRYWESNQYLGLGPSAHSYDGFNIRRYNPSSLKGYLKFFADNCQGENNHFYEEENLTKEELMEERILTRMRVKEGIDLKTFREEFGENELARLLGNAERWLSSGEVKIGNDHLSLTSDGVMTSNQIILSLCM